MAAESPSPRIRRNVAYAGIAEGSRALLAAVLVLVATRVLGPDEYGLFALALGIGALALLPSDFGVSPAAGRFIAEHRGDRPAIAAVVADALRLKLVFAGGVSLLVALIAAPLADAYGEPGLADPLRWTALALFGQSIFSLFVAVFVSMGRTSLQALMFASESLAEVVLVVGSIAITATATAAAIGRSAAFLLGGVLGIVVALRLLGPAIRPRIGAIGPGRRLAGYAGALFVVDAAYALFASIDVLLIGAYLDSEAVGLFEAPYRLTAVVALAGAAVASAVAPRLAQAEGGEQPATEALMLGLRMLVAFGAAGAAVCLVWAEPIVDVLLGDEYAESADVLRAFSPYVFLVVVGPVVTMGVNYVGLGRRRIPVVLLALAVNVILDIILIPEIGIVAGAIATSIAFAIYVPAHVWFLHRALGLDLAALGRTAARALLAAGALAGVLVLVGTEDLGAAEIAGGALLGVLAFAAVLLLTREVRPAEVRALLARRRGS